MRITTRIAWDLRTGAVLDHEWHEWGGSVIECKGKERKAMEAAQGVQRQITEEERANFQEQANFMRTLRVNYETMFAEHRNILGTLKAVWQPIFEKGIEQAGFSPEEEAARRGEIQDVTARGYARTTQAVQERLAARGGGQRFIPSGTEAQLQGEIAQRFAEQEASAQRDVTRESAELGRRKFMAASSALGGIAGDPTRYASSALGGETAATSAIGGASTSAARAFGGARDIYDRRGKLWKTVGSILGGAAGGAIGGPAGATIGSTLGGAIGEGAD